LRAFTKRTPGPRARIYISAGIHGDEPASPLALLNLLEAETFDRRADWFLCPLLNPVGLFRGVRENPEGIDLNRDYREPQSAEARSHIAWLQRQPNFDLSLCLHEDWESTGFYLYELAVQPHPGLAEAVLESVRPSLPVEPSALIDGREANQGIIRPLGDLTQRDKWPESLYLHVRHHVPLHYTFESPSKSPLAIRIAALRAAVELVLGRTN
jgi:murein peptide amidase A